MKIRKLAFLLVFVMISGLLSGCETRKQAEEMTEALPVNYENLMSQWKQQTTGDTVTCWYTDENDKMWLENAAQQFESEYSVKVDVVYYDGVSIFEDMNQANQTGEGPDVYLLGNDQLQLAAESGMAEVNSWFDDAFWSGNYPEVARNAVTYQEKQYGYPIYFDTYCLVYDANLLETAPASIDDILAFLDEYEDTGSTKAIFRWDVADPYINSMFIASYADLFGVNGDVSNEFKVNDAQSVAAMEYFQSLSAYLWMNKDNISHDTVMNRIKDGTLVLGLCKSDILPTLYEMQAANAATNTGEEVANPDVENQSAEGSEQSEENADDGAEETEQPEENADDGAEETEQSEESADDSAEETEQTENSTDSEDITNYQIAYVPSLTAELSSSAFSTTYSAYINPYGKDTMLGNMFALYLSYACAAGQYAGNGKLPVINQNEAFDAMQTIVYAQYLNSRPVPKVMVLGDYLTESGITFDAIWEGQNVQEQLDLLQQTMEEKIK